MKRYFLLSLLCLVIQVSPCAHGETGNAIVEQINQFSLDIFNKIETDCNIVLSPYSLASVLVYLIQGSAGETREQLLRIFHPESDVDPAQMITMLNSINHELIATNVCQGWFKCKFYSILKSLNIVDYTQGYIIDDSVWVDKSITLVPAFENTIHGSVHVGKMDFSNPVDSMNTINAWVAKRTHNLVSDLIPEETLNADTRLVLVNAIYFKGLWKLPFNSKDTVDANFTMENHLTVKTSFMKQNNQFDYMETDAFQMLQLPYTNSSLAMIIILPKKLHNVDEIADNLTAASFSELLNKLIHQKVVISLPKFGIVSSFPQLTDTLTSLGVTDAFDSTAANFSKMSKTPLYISQIIQKAIIEVNESGTTAAAATAAAIGITAVIRPVVFNADHPFLFFIIDRKTRLILFTGQLMNP